MKIIKNQRDVALKKLRKDGKQDEYKK